MPRDKVKSFAERRYSAVAKKFSRGRLGTQIVEILEDDGSCVVCRIWDGRGKNWRGRKIKVAREKLIAAPAPSDPRWRDVRADVAMELRLEIEAQGDRIARQRERKRQQAAKLKLKREIVAARRLLEQHGYFIEEPNDKTNDDFF